MDDTCAVCAETLQWVAYGQCGHREVCSTCMARLRFICDDRRCCLCKSESSVIFVTKALGDYTMRITDFSVFPADPTEGQVGQYWYHEGTKAFFDDVDHFKMIKATCRLSCVVCDKMDEQGDERPKRTGNFRNIEQVKSHLFHSHKLFMCILCLEGRKIFICEQNLYTRAQLNQHIRTGDSEVDGSETERGGFMGHPMCEFCENPFYGDNELYSHMQTEHYTCHMCQRQNPGDYEYYRNYDELEIHFRKDHFLCEDEGCLAKKFIVFISKSEITRHVALEHGGKMSRYEQSIALQIPTSFRYRRSVEQDRRQRRQVLRLDYTDGELAQGIQARLELDTVSADTARATSSDDQPDSHHRHTGPFESLSTTDSESSSRNRLAQGQSSTTVPLEPSSFPPLPKSSRTSRQKSQNQNSMAARLRRRNNVTVVHPSPAWPAVGRQPTPTTSTSQIGPALSYGRVASSSSASSSTSVPTTLNGYLPSKNSMARILVSASSSSSSMTNNTAAPNKVNQSASASNNRSSFEPSISNFPPVSAIRTSQPASEPLSIREDVHTANKSLVERIRAGLEFDDDKFAVFKVISSEYRQGLIETAEYLAYVHQFGISHLIPELAKLCPDARKQKELLVASNTSLRSNGIEIGVGKKSSPLKQKKASQKGKEKIEDTEISISKAPTEVLSRDGYRSIKGKSKVLAVDEPPGLSFPDWPQTEPSRENDSKKAGGGKKQQKKMSKFHRVRLGDSSPAAVLDLANSGAPLTGEKLDVDDNSALPVRSVWQNGGGHKLVGKLATTKKGHGQ